MINCSPENSANSALEQKIADGLSIERAKANGYAETIQYHYLLSLYRKSENVAPDVAAKLQERIVAVLDGLMAEKAFSKHDCEPDTDITFDAQSSSRFKCLQQELQLRHARPEGPGVQLAFDTFFESGDNPLLSDTIDSGIESSDVVQPLSELKSMQPLRLAWQKERREMLVRQAIANAPESAGPLNPEMLLVKSFSAMKDLSPAYMNQFIAYMETLLWLGDAS